MAERFIAIECVSGSADDRALGWNCRFMRAHAGAALQFSSAADAHAAALRATNRVAGSRISTIRVEGVLS